MRHLQKGRSLSRSISHRKALLSNLAQELFQRKRIRTTLAKAKELRSYAEKLVTNAKKGHLAARRHALRRLNRASVVKTLFDEIAPSYANRNGGYTRIIKLGQRIGDSAPLAIIELVGFESVAAAVEAEKKEKEKQKAATKTSGTAAKKGATAKEGPKKKSKEKAPSKIEKAGTKKSAGAKSRKDKSGDKS